MEMNLENILEKAAAELLEQENPSAEDIMTVLTLQLILL